MIHSFSFDNFYSFKDKNEFTFVVNENAPDTTDYFLSPTKTRISKLLTVIGPNASGKTNVLRALSFLRWLIHDTFLLKSDDKINFKPFMFCEDVTTTTNFEVTFEIKNKIYNYKTSVNQIRFLSEKLSIKGTTKYITVFERDWDEGKKKYAYTLNNEFKHNAAFKNSIRENASFISTGSRFNFKTCVEIANYWGKVISNVVEIGNISSGAHPTALFAGAIDYFTKNDGLRMIADEAMANFDLGLSKIDIKKDTKKEGTYFVSGVHEVDGKSYELSAEYESIGTRRLYVLLRYILTALENGGVVILDEFDTDLHPSMLEPILKWFSTPSKNPKNAQILFSTHGLQVLNYFDKYQIYFVEKNDKLISESWRLDEVSNVSPKENFYSRYIAGAYGAIPKN